MKRLDEIATEHIRALRKNEFVFDTEQIIKIGTDAAHRIKSRVENDPAIAEFAEFFAQLDLILSQLKKQDFEQYFTWLLLDRSAPMLGEGFEKAHFDFWKKGCLSELHCAEQ